MQATRCEGSHGCAIIRIMKLPFSLRWLRREVESSLAPLLSEESIVDNTPPLLKTVGWISAGLGALALGLVVGRELRQRYQFNRRTPYDRYSRAGAAFGDDFGLGI